MEFNSLFYGISNAIFAIIGLIMGIFFAGFPCLMFIYLSGIWTCLSVIHFANYANIRRTKITSGEQSDA
jgi:hypothetical protein